MREAYQVRTPSVIHEAFEGEVVIVDLDSGDYYSLAEVGAAVWTCLLEGLSVEETIDAIESQYEGDSGEIRASVRHLVAKLAEQNLIIRRSGEAAPTDVKNNSVGNHVKVPFVSPTLNSYSDMRDLLLIDPIHDVDEGGWPQVRKGSDDSEGN